MTTTTINQKFVRSGLQVACDRRNFHKEADKPSAMTAVTDPKEVAFYENIFKMHDERIEQKKKPIPMFKSTMLVAGENGELQQEEIVFELLDPDSARIIRSLLEKVRAPLPRGRKAGGGTTEGADTTGASAAGEGGTTAAAAAAALLTEEPAVTTAAAPAATVNAVASEAAAEVAPAAKAAVEAAVVATAAALPAAAAVETAVVVEKAAVSSDAAKAVADLFDADEA